jgi:hypothetical protein
MHGYASDDGFIVPEGEEFAPAPAPTPAPTSSASEEGGERASEEAKEANGVKGEGAKE